MAGIPQWPGQTKSAEGQHHKAVSLVPILNGYLVEVTFDATDTVTQRHALNRAYRGGFVVNASGPQAVTILTPATVSRAGTDITQYFTIESLTSWSGTITIWLF